MGQKFHIVDDKFFGGCREFVVLTDGPRSLVVRFFRDRVCTADGLPLEEWGPKEWHRAEDCDENTA